MIRLYVFDADETLRTTLVPGQVCPHAADEWALLPGVADRLAAIPWSPEGPWMAIASNQDHVGYGHLTSELCHQLLADLARQATGGRAAARIAFCPHRPEEGCGCRKPAPGLLLALIAAHGVTAAETLFVGDADCDEEAARRAGVHFLRAWAFFGQATAGPPK